jgi:hypothetical protein
MLKLKIVLTLCLRRHQWIFITDTVDAIYRPDDWFPEAMMDQLAEIAGALPVGVRQTLTFVRLTLTRSSSSQDPSRTGMITPNDLTNFSTEQPLRRPLLNSLRQIDSIRDLIPFFSNVSISSYESVYASGGNVDWEAVEQGIMDDMFDGR